MTWAVIGAGPAALSAVRNMTLQGVDVVGFEIHTGVGGMWDIESPTSTMYESSHLISSKTTTAFAEHPFAADVPDYPSRTTGSSWATSATTPGASSSTTATSSRPRWSGSTRCPRAGR